MRRRADGGARLGRLVNGGGRRLGRRLEGAVVQHHGPPVAVVGAPHGGVAVEALPDHRPVMNDVGIAIEVSSLVVTAAAAAGFFT